MMEFFSPELQQTLCLTQRIADEKWLMNLDRVQVPGKVSIVTNNEELGGIVGCLEFTHPFWGDETILWTTYNGLYGEGFVYYISGTSVSVAHVQTQEHLMEAVWEEFHEIRNKWMQWDQEKELANAQVPSN
jgi:hypothetical protein